jgi:pilus assembly protein CpaE
MTPLVALMGRPDRRLEEMVRACGLKTTVLPDGPEMLALPEPLKEQPDVVLVDVRGGGRLPTGLAGVRVRHPQAAIVLVTATLDPVLMLDAMRAGVGECVTEPVTPATLGEALTRVLALRGGQVGEVIAIVGAKGGVGATTLAVNSATALAANGSVLIIDFAAYCGDAAVLMSAEPRFSVLDALENTHRLDQAFFEGLAVRTAAGPWLLPSPAQPTAHAHDPNRIRLLLEFAMRHYRYVVLDVPRTSRAVLESLSLAKAIVVVTTQEVASVRSASTIADMLRRRYGREKTAVAVTRFRPDAEITVEDVEMAVHGEAPYRIPNDYTAAVAAANLGQPLVTEGGGPLAAAIIEFAQRVSGTQPPALVPVAASAGLLSRLTSLVWTAAS